MTRIIGPLPCLTCKRPVWWDRVGSTFRLLEGMKPHDCPGEVTQLETVGTVCGAWMPYVGEPCARRKGHGSNAHDGAHRRRVVMDDDAAARRGRRAA